jgi:hypothetical protein
VVNRRLVVRVGLLEHVVKYVGASRSRSRALSSPVNCEGPIPVVVTSLRVPRGAASCPSCSACVFVGAPWTFSPPWARCPRACLS